jgi:transposase
VALLIGQMVKMGLPEVLDRHIPRHWTQRGLSWGWTAVIWLAYIVRTIRPKARVVLPPQVVIMLW